MPLQDSIKEIIAQGPGVPIYRYEAILHTRDIDYPIHKVISIDISRDYVSGWTDNISLTVLMPLLDILSVFYTDDYKLNKYRFNTEVTLKRTYLKEVRYTRYKALIPDNLFGKVNPALLADTPTTVDQRADIHDLTIQLVSIFSEPMQMLSTKEVYKDVDRKKFLESALYDEASRIRVVGSKPINKISVVEPDNEETSDLLVIPTHTPLLRLAEYIQFHGGGLYKYGVGSYIQPIGDQNVWHVYPTHDPNRFTDRVKKVQIYILPYTSPAEHLTTYSVSGDILSILVNRKEDVSENNTRPLNLPFGVRIADPEAMLNGGVKVSGGTVTGSSDVLSTEKYIHTREDGLNIQQQSISATTNLYPAVSEANKNRVTDTYYTWNNSDPELLYPGMPARIYQSVEGKVIKLSGSLLFNHTICSLAGQGSGHEDYVNLTLLSIGVGYVEDV